MFHRRSQRAGFRPRAYDSGRYQFLLPLVVGLVSGYYIFNEPLKQAAIEVKAKAEREGALKAAREGALKAAQKGNEGEGKVQSNGAGDVPVEQRTRK